VSIETLSEIDEKIIVFDGLDKAFIGHGFNWQSQNHIAIYDYDKIIKILMDRDGMSAEEAYEYADFNILGAYLGKYTPLVVIKG